MTNVKVKDLADTTSFNSTDKLMLLVDEANNTVQNIVKSDFVNGLISSDANNALTSTGGALYVHNAELTTGDLSNLTTTDKSNLVSAVNEVNTEAGSNSGKIGNLANLDTTDKSNMVNAVNEVASSITAGGANIDLSNLSTIGENRLHALKGYLETGSAYTDSQLYNDVYEMKHTNGTALTDTVIINNAEVSLAYTLAKSGCKIVDVANKSTVDSLNAEYGSSMYFIIDETNHTAALPYGDIYGLMNKRADANWENLTGSNIELTTSTNIGTYELDLSNYMPLDGHIYEAVFDVSLERTGGSADFTTYAVERKLGGYFRTWYHTYINLDNKLGAQFKVVLPALTRTIRVNISGHNMTSHSLKLLSWRKCGGNY